LLRRDECPDFIDLDSLRPEAEAMLRNAIEVIKTDATGDQAAELLAGLLESFPAFSQQLGGSSVEISLTVGRTLSARH